MLVGVLLEHKSGRDGDVLNQISRYVRSVIKNFDEKRVYDGLPTMAIIFYNGREKWNPLTHVENGYPEYWHGAVLPFKCTFVNLANIPDEECFACSDVHTGMGVVAMKYAFDKEKLLDVLPKFAKSLSKMDPEDVSCLLEKINVYLYEYIGKDIFKELDMAFVSIGQKYGFESAGDYFRKQIADARAEAEEDKLNTARGLLEDGVPMETLVRRFNLTEMQILGK